MAHIFRMLVLKMHLSIFLAPSASFRLNVQVLSSNVVLPRINLQNLKIAKISERSIFEICIFDRPLKCDN